MICDCQRNIFNCEENVRRFLSIGNPDGSVDLAARDELLAKMTPLVERIVGRTLQGRWRQDQASVVQETLLKLCDRAKIRTWLESPNRPWFCYWVAVVAVNTAREWIRHAGPTLGGSTEVLPAAVSPQTPQGLQRQAEELRKAIIAALSEFEVEWQLVFCMKFSYLDPSITDIANTVKVPERTIFFRLHKIKERIACRCTSLLSPAVAKATIIGAFHPVEGFQRLGRSLRDRINDAIRRILTAYPIEHQLAFYIKYSPLSASSDEIAAQLREEANTVRGWFTNIDAEINAAYDLIRRADLTPSGSTEVLPVTDSPQTSVVAQQSDSLAQEGAPQPKSPVTPILGDEEELEQVANRADDFEPEYQETLSARLRWFHDGLDCRQDSLLPVTSVREAEEVLEQVANWTDGFEPEYPETKWAGRRRFHGGLDILQDYPLPATPVLRVKPEEASEQVAKWADDFESDYPETLSDRLSWFHDALDIRQDRLLLLVGLASEKVKELSQGGTVDWKRVAEEHEDGAIRAEEVLLQVLAFFRYDCQTMREQIHQGAPEEFRVPKSEGLPVRLQEINPSQRDISLLKEIARGVPESIPASVIFLGDLQ
jgi:DNA-directed RNA polymerase specialized sigma24 family protein